MNWPECEKPGHEKDDANETAWVHEDLLECTPQNISLYKDKLEVSKKDACASESIEPIEFEKLITLLNIVKAAAAPLVENKKKHI